MPKVSKVFTVSEEAQVYVGPETLLPLASTLAAITGVLLMFWRRVVGFFRTAVQVTARLFSRQNAR